MAETVGETGSLAERAVRFYRMAAVPDARMLDFMSIVARRDIGSSDEYLHSIRGAARSIPVVRYESILFDTLGSNLVPVGVVQAVANVRLRDGSCHTIIYRTHWIWERPFRDGRPDWYVVALEHRAADEQRC